MPMLDAYIRGGALTEAIAERLVARLTDLLLRHEGVRSDNPRARRLAWVWVHRPMEVFAGGRVADRPRYKLVPCVPEGTWGLAGSVMRLADIAGVVLGSPEKGAAYAQALLAGRPS
jgi:hypothetical protein